MKTKAINGLVCTALSILAGCAYRGEERPIPDWTARAYFCQQLVEAAFWPVQAD